MDTNAEPVVAEQTFGVPVDTLWKAITDKYQMRQWYFDTIPEFEPEIGFEVEFNVHCEGKNYLHCWKVTEVVPHERIVYNWKYGGYPGNSYVTWELSETPSGTRLKLTHRGQETFRLDDPVFSRESCQEGWVYIVCDSLKAFLERQGS